MRQSTRPGDASAARDAEVRDHDSRARLAREHVDRRAPAQEVLDHLRGDDLGIGAHALRGHAVVGGEREHDGMRSTLGAPPRSAREPHRDLLEPAEAARRLGEGIEVALRIDGAVRAPGREWRQGDGE